MAADAVYDAIQAYLQAPANVAVLADANGIVPPFRFENELFALPDPSQAWVAVALTSGLYEQQSLGATVQANNRWDEQGHLWLPVFVGEGTGVSRARQLAKQLADIFRGLTLLSNSLEFRAAYIGNGSPAPEEGNWYKLEVAIEYRRVDA